MAGGEIAKSEAANFAKQTGGVTLEMVNAGKILAKTNEYIANKTSANFANKVMTPFWKYASKGHAFFVKDNTTVFINFSKARPNSFWFKYEKPDLLKRGININVQPVGQ